MFTSIDSTYLLEKAQAATTIPTPGVGISTPGVGIPSLLGTIRDSWTPSTDYGLPTIIHIQDAHCNYYAQKKIAEIIEYLNTKYGVSSINLEGGARDYDLSPFTDISDKSIRAKASDQFVKEGLLNGAEYFAVNNPQKVNLWGVEDIGLYIENLRSYRSSLTKKNDADKLLASISRALSSRKLAIFPKDLLEFDIKYGQYKSENIDFREYITYLAKAAKTNNIDIGALTNLSVLSRTAASEGDIDFKAANIQRDQLIDALQKTLSMLELGELVTKTVEFKSDRISQKDFYAYLVKKTRAVDIDIATYPQLQKYITYISAYDAVEKLALTEEMEIAENSIRNALCKNEDQHKLCEQSKNLALLKNLFNITLTSDDYMYYKSNEASFDSSNFAAMAGEDISRLDGYRKETEQFYVLSAKRDEAFLKNLRKANISILVTGGFHTKNLAKLFKQNNISYVSIMPNFKTADGYKCPYFNILSGKDALRIKDALPSVLNSSLATASQLCPALDRAVRGDAALSATPTLAYPHIADGIHDAAEAHKGDETAMRRLSGLIADMRLDTGLYYAAYFGVPKESVDRPALIEQIFNNMRNPETKIFLYIKNGSLIGFESVRIFADTKRGSIDHIAVVENERRHGIGGDLLHSAVEHFRKNGAGAFSVISNNSHIINWLDNMGYTTEPNARQWRLLPIGHNLDDLTYRIVEKRSMGSYALALFALDHEIIKNTFVNITPWAWAIGAAVVLISYIIWRNVTKNGSEVRRREIDAELRLKSTIEQLGYQPVGGLRLKTNYYNRLKRLIGAATFAGRPNVYSPLNDRGDAIDFAEDAGRKTAEISGRIKATGKKKDIRILVIGAGTGIDAITAYREAKASGLSVTLDAIDIDEDAAETARVNFDLLSDGRDSVNILKVEEGKELDGINKKYDLVLFNAPHPVSYQPEENSTLTDMTRLSRLVHKVPRILSEDGLFLLRGPYWISNPKINRALAAQQKNIDILSRDLEWNYPAKDSEEEAGLRVTFEGRLPYRSGRQISGVTKPTMAKAASPQDEAAEFIRQRGGAWVGFTDMAKASLRNLAFTRKTMDSQIIKALEIARTIFGKSSGIAFRIAGDEIGFVLPPELAAQDVKKIFVAYQQALIDEPWRNIDGNRDPLLVPFEPMGCVKVSLGKPGAKTLTDAIEALKTGLKHAETEQGLAKEPAPGQVRGLFRISEKFHVPAKTGQSRLSAEEAGKVRTYKDNMEKKAGGVIYEPEDEYPSLKRNSLWGIVNDCVRSQNKPAVYFIRGPPDYFYVVRADGKGTVQVIKIDAGYSPDSNTEKRFREILALSGRPVPASGLYPFKCVQDSHDHEFGNDIIKLLNLSLLENFHGGPAILSNDEIALLLERAESTLNQNPIIRAEGFGVVLRASVVNSQELGLAQGQEKNFARVMMPILEKMGEAEWLRTQSLVDYKFYLDNESEINKTIKQKRGMQKINALATLEKEQKILIGLFGTLQQDLEKTGVNRMQSPTPATGPNRDKAPALSTEEIKGITTVKDDMEKKSGETFINTLSDYERQRINEITVKAADLIPENTGERKATLHLSKIVADKGLINPEDMERIERELIRQNRMPPDTDTQPSERTASIALKHPFTVEWGSMKIKINRIYAKGVIFDSRNELLRHNGAGSSTTERATDIEGRIIVRPYRTDPNGASLMSESVRCFLSNYEIFFSDYFREKNILVRYPVGFGEFPGVVYKFPKTSSRKGQAEAVGYFLYGCDDGYQNSKFNNKSVESKYFAGIGVIKAGEVLRAMHKSTDAKVRGFVHKWYHPGNYYTLFHDLSLIHDLGNSRTLGWDNMDKKQYLAEIITDLTYATSKLTVNKGGLRNTFLRGYAGKDSAIYDEDLWEMLKSTFLEGQRRPVWEIDNPLVRWLKVHIVSETYESQAGKPAHPDALAESIERNEITIASFAAARERNSQPVGVLIPVMLQKDTDDQEFNKLKVSINNLIADNKLALRVNYFAVVPEDSDAAKAATKASYEKARAGIISMLPKDSMIFSYVPAIIRDAADGLGNPNEKVITDGMLDSAMPDIMVRVAVSHHLAYYLRHPDSEEVRAYVEGQLQKLLGAVGEGDMKDILKRIFEKDFRLMIEPFGFERFEQYRRNEEIVARAA